MIKSITVTNHLGESIKLELAFPEKSGFVIHNIDGLGASKANINLTELATTDGALFNSSRVLSRNIVMKLGLLSRPTVEEMRLLSYKYFPIKKSISLLIETDNRKCEIYGYVESNEPDIFNRMETTQISIICPDPYFYSIEEEVTIFSGIEPVFEFEFSNESLTENLIEFGLIINQTLKFVYYSGDANVGVKIIMHALGDVSNVTIHNTTTRESMTINSTKLIALTGYDIHASDDIIISTIKGNKYIFLLRDGEYINILNCLDRGVDWFQLVNGDNLFAYTAETGESNLQFRIENKIVYEGV